MIACIAGVPLVRSSSPRPARARVLTAAQGSSVTDATSAMEGPQRSAATMP
jgi:hypothetical protein